MGSMFQKDKKVLHPPLLYKINNNLYDKYFTEDVLNQIIFYKYKDNFNIIINKCIGVDFYYELKLICIQVSI
jgi:hypothetical protein